MTLSEFRAWLEGFSASFNEAPNAEQWAAIQEKMNTVSVGQVPIDYSKLIPTDIIGPDLNFSNGYIPPFSTCEAKQ